MIKKKSTPIIRLLASADQDYFLDCVDELYSTIEKESPEGTVYRETVSGGRLKSYLVRKISAMPFLHKLNLGFAKSDTINFASMISGDFRLMIPAAFLSGRNYIYMYDVWPRFQQWIFPLLGFFNITYVFFSSRQVYDSYQEKYPGGPCKAMWLPEALNLSDYHFQLLKDKTIDVLEFGRNYDAYHDLIAGPLSSNNHVHVFKKPEVQVLFPKKSDFIHALSQSRIVICIPSSISHPERAENISTMTLRYLQAMASKCLIVGILPSDMEEAFGYIPIVEIEMEKAGQQILEVLKEYDIYLPLIERNYEQVKMNHQWSNRWKVIREKMEENNA
jgi:hypothetical protein